MIKLTEGPESLSGQSLGRERDQGALPTTECISHGPTTCKEGWPFDSENASSSALWPDSSHVQLDRLWASQRNTRGNITLLAAGYLTGVGYGAQLILHIACMRILWATAKSWNSKQSYFLMCYISVLCALDTMWTGVSAFGLQATYIDNLNYPSGDPDSPSGPVAFLGIEFSLPFNIIGQVVFTLGNLLADALLLWRCQVIWAAASGPEWSQTCHICRCVPCSLSLGLYHHGLRSRQLIQTWDYSHRRQRPLGSFLVRIALDLA
ncbi:hypothetical protein C8J56DRAFT_1167243 [Mycena floridula]|nr:hypothetical protein C8J56DRAFT_1167243 [Mycena floridula]